MCIPQRHIDQMQDAINNGKPEEIIYFDLGRYSIIWTLIFKCTDEDGTETFYACESSYEEGECPDIESDVKNLRQVVKKEVTKMEWVDWYDNRT